MNRVLILLICSSFALAFLFFACQNKNPVVPEIQDVIRPLTVGNYWAYAKSYYINGQPNGLTDTSTVRIIADTTLVIEGDTYTAFIRDRLYNRSNRVAEAKWFEWNGEDGLYNLGGFSEADTLVTRFLELKYPVSVGESWEVPRLVYDFRVQEFLFSDTLTYTCVAIDSVFETSLGNFNCYVFHYRLEAQEEDASGFTDFFFYYALGIGLVGLEQKYYDYLLDKQSLYDYKSQ